MDVHKKSWSISIVTEHSAHKTLSQPPTSTVLNNYMQRDFPGATYHAAYEADYSGFWIHDQPRQNGTTAWW
jgi:transposase